MWRYFRCGDIVDVETFQKWRFFRCGYLSDVEKFQMRRSVDMCRYKISGGEVMPVKIKMVKVQIKFHCYGSVHR